MTTPTVQLFASLLAVATLGATVLLVALRIAPASRGVRTAVQPVALGLSAAVAVGCMAGSLYFSEVADYVPCTLCWYQRIAMYSLAIILTIAAARRDRGVRIYGIVLASIGFVIAVYHWALERVPDLDAGVCSVVVPCDLVWFERFGFVTLPFMAACGFFAIITLLTTLPKD